MTIGYFQFDQEEFSVAVVLKDFWEENGYLDDSGSEEEHMPDGFFALTDAIYEHNYNSIEEAKKLLKIAGFEEKVLFTE